MAAPIGNWQNELEKYVKGVRSKKIIDELAVKRKEEDKILTFQRHFSKGNISWIKTYFENCQNLHTKSTIVGSTARRNGNTMFQKKNYKKAAELYTQAILNSPPESQELPLAYGNRSAVLFHLLQYKECLIDIEEALSHGFPRSLQYKLFIRKLHCFTKLKCRQDFNTVVRDALEALDEADTDQKRKEQLEREIKDLEVKNTNSHTTAQPAPNLSPVPKVSYGCSHVLVQASEATSLEYNSTQGRYLTANRDIRAGDTLIVELPFAAVLLPEHYPTHCHHCFVKLTYTYPCRKCTQVMYCSPICANDSWSTYHSIECPYLQLLHSVGIAHLSLRVILVAGLSYLKEFRRLSKQSGESQMIPGLDSHGQYSRNYRTVYDLMTHAEDMDKQDLFQYTMTADLLLTILQHSGWFKTGSSSNSAQFKSKEGEAIGEVAKTQDHDMNGLKYELDNLNLKDVDNEIDESNEKEQSKQIENSKDRDKLSETNSDKCFISHEENKKDIHSIIYDKETCENRIEAKCNNNDKSTSLDEDCEAENSVGTCIDLVDCDVELYIGGLLLRHILQLVCNAHAITELQCGEALAGSQVEELSEVRVATAIYPTASLMNHSCDPTIISSFHKDILVVRAVRDMKKGEEIFNSYGIHHKRMAYRERQSRLREQYFFTCQCPPCVDGEKADSLLFSYKCVSCSGPLVKTQTDLYICSGCGYQTAKIDTSKADQATTLFQQGLELLQRNKIKDALQVMKKCCKLRTEVLYKHNKDLSETQDCVARCLASLGQFSEAAAFLKDSLSTVKVIYGANSVEVANELQKLSEILISAHEWLEALTVTQEAIQVFTVHYGREKDTVKELISAKRQLKEMVSGYG